MACTLEFDPVRVPQEWIDAGVDPGLQLGEILWQSREAVPALGGCKRLVGRAVGGEDGDIELRICNCSDGTVLAATPTVDRESGDTLMHNLSAPAPPPCSFQAWHNGQLQWVSIPQPVFGKISLPETMSWVQDLGIGAICIPMEQPGSLGVRYTVSDSGSPADCSIQSDIRPEVHFKLFSCSGGALVIGPQLHFKDGTTTYTGLEALSAITIFAADIVDNPVFGASITFSGGELQIGTGHLALDLSGKPPHPCNFWAGVVLRWSMQPFTVFVNTSDWTIDFLSAEPEFVPTGLGHVNSPNLTMTFSDSPVVLDDADNITRRLLYYYSNYFCRPDAIGTPCDCFVWQNKIWKRA